MYGKLLLFGFVSIESILEQLYLISTNTFLWREIKKKFRFNFSIELVFQLKCETI